MKSPKEEDLFQLLSDSLVEAIFCKVGSIKWLLRCEAVCKRWNRLCPLVDELVFDYYDEFWMRRTGLALVTLIERVLSSHVFRVRSLQVLNAPSRLVVDCVPSWLEQLSAHLELLNLDFHDDFVSKGKVLPDKVRFQRLVHLSISGCILEEEPSCLMPCLTSCKFTSCKFTRMSHSNRLIEFKRWIEKFVQLSPLLKEMKLVYCSYGRLCISSQNLETLVVRGTDRMWLEVEAPRLLHLEIQNVNKLIVKAQALHEFVLWSGEEYDWIEFCTMPRVSRWIFKNDYSKYDAGYNGGWTWTCEGTVEVLESAKDTEIGHVELARPLICDFGVPLPTWIEFDEVKCLHLVKSIDQNMLQSLRAGIYHLVDDHSLGLRRLDMLRVVILDTFDEERCDALELLLKEFEHLDLVEVVCGKTASGCRFLNRLTRLHRQMEKIRFCWVNKMDINYESSAECLSLIFHA